MYLKLGRRYADAVCTSARMGMEEGREVLRMEMLWYGCHHHQHVVLLETEIRNSQKEGKYIRIHPPPPNQLLQIRRQVIPRVLLFDPTAPIVLARTDQDLLCVRRHRPIERFCMIDC